LVKTRIYLLTKDKFHDPVTQLSDTKQPDKNSHFASRYQYILELDPKQNYQEASKAIEALIKDDSERVPYIVTRAEIEIENEHWDQACDILRQGKLIYPNNVSITSLYVKALINNRQSKEAMQLLEQQLRLPAAPVEYYRLHLKPPRLRGFQASHMNH
jgi:predicted Zn-dependent protease